MVAFVFCFQVEADNDVGITTIVSLYHKVLHVVVEESLKKKYNLRTVHVVQYRV